LFFGFIITTISLLHAQTAERRSVQSEVAQYMRAEKEHKDERNIVDIAERRRQSKGQHLQFVFVCVGIITLQLRACSHLAWKRTEEKHGRGTKQGKEQKSGK
jgi:adenylate kinase family enzyme